MIVITLTDCPISLRGDLTKWLQEIDTGVYVGKVSARVRDQLWTRITENTKNGRATMVYSAKNEQRLDFRVHNTTWEPINFDGLKLMLRPSPARIQKLGEQRMGYSNAAKIRKAKQMTKKNNKGEKFLKTYLVLDVETTGLSVAEHEIIEIGALKIKDGQVEATFQALVKSKGSVPKSIEVLTGISDIMLEEKGKELEEVLPEFLEFAGNMPVVSHNGDFDYSFLRAACQQLDIPLFSNRCLDTLKIARRLVDDVKNYKLSTLLKYFGIEVQTMHRSIEDCKITFQLYEKLIELEKEQK
ncbi:CRISPR-associated protein Cas2 / DEDDh 3'-5' exonuclease domain [Candidatus Syntrophocurvum alkaliphilum]|uniref:CRISPR-associated protein Cas2 / DEDDh 3'-5' exonuclease domain n=1 Tax=Candidatus Syntrophocurvum alkaliphilum TaxID=2293317 RepID=A0A6I6DGL9_9FIRM|nr:type I-E CRISPR-associated endoribonuclease Cas2e [Candidatus Syntrophocurvum alkaliphilum]QGT99540.1 CRISPR-associated protein Cas2 / DEDDh 3'-5' exonuclease domain [Candidatus Syntrophocurvum alkaliphilum]